ncbi:hypothetical protein L0Y81_02470 [Burkholderia multivorans]|uniref:hypothetical protein n=1 Tax=Burkholderia multivorans TaxID=87883 RepID=UPI00158EC3F4|nr:hypothetical protein [Burkholderia multivorans]MBR8452470.1 hypothetical protein [Burkholderia multivorans]MBU9448884.1 hypothetical protein [Burkholderia multivorans]MCL4643182.1 hypothetical protein [Burkholderia multivorans]UQN86228.1 hypothetical protein L0Y85_02400 [Burkholderia multivorans]UQO71430.1 hypothetical protein L0Y81_02470 [Burkholderia multivorans]
MKGSFQRRTWSTVLALLVGATGGTLPRASVRYSALSILIFLGGVEERESVRKTGIEFHNAVDRPVVDTAQYGFAAAVVTLILPLIAALIGILMFYFKVTEKGECLCVSLGIEKVKDRIPTLFE